MRDEYTIGVPVTPLEFCEWLDMHLESVNHSMLPREWVKSGPIQQYYIVPPYLEILQAARPYTIKVLLCLCALYRGDRIRKLNSDSDFLVLSIAISEIDGGINLRINCEDTQYVTLESFVREVRKLGELPKVAPSTIENQQARVATELAVAVAKVRRVKRWTPRSKADNWLIHVFFDEYHEDRLLPTFRDEWLRIRKEIDLLEVPQDPGDSMRKVISMERKERNRMKPE